ncbi:MAG: hypothetical protein HY699_16870 [Deltaproteobacteria bacterium]|nr:hypothetical protein [Deltaproteobacteria bacterium]
MRRLVAVLLAAALLTGVGTGLAEEPNAAIKAERERLEQEQNRIRTEQKKLNDQMREVRRELLKLRLKERGLPTQRFDKPPGAAQQPDAAPTPSK